MQQTFHKPNETEGQPGLRMKSTLTQDYEFADYSMADYDDRAGVIQQATRSTVWFVKNLFFYTKKRWILRVGWIFEFIANVALLTVAGIEIRSSCLIEFGVEVMCYTCYGLPFLIWIAIFSFLWLLNTYMHVLLISRGFAFPANFSKVLEDNRRKGIPGIAVIVFMFLLILMFAMIIAGITMLVHSSSCPTADHIKGVRTLKRDETLFWAIIIAMIVAFITLPLIRFSEVIFKKKEHKEQEENQEGKYGTFHKYMDIAKQKEHEYMDKMREKAPEYMEKLREKEQKYLEPYMEKYHVREKRDQLVGYAYEKEQQYVEPYMEKYHVREKVDHVVDKAWEKEQEFMQRYHQHHDQYLNNLQPKPTNQAPLPVQSL